MSLNWFMPALLNISVGSSLTTIGADGTMRCSLLSKNFLKDSRISFAVNMFFVAFNWFLTAKLLFFSDPRKLFDSFVYRVIISKKSLCNTEKEKHFYNMSKTTLKILIF